MIGQCCTKINLPFNPPCIAQHQDKTGNFCSTIQIVVDVNWALHGNKEQPKDIFVCSGVAMEWGGEEVSKTGLPALRSTVISDFKSHNNYPRDIYNHISSY